MYLTMSYSQNAYIACFFDCAFKYILFLFKKNIIPYDIITRVCCPLLQTILDKATTHTKSLLQKSEDRAKALEKVHVCFCAL